MVHESRLSSEAMLVKAKPFQRQLWRHLRRCSASQARESIDKLSLHSVVLSKSQGMEKDLNALESELARSARKQDLMKIKKKWNLNPPCGSRVACPHFTLNSSADPLSSSQSCADAQ
ncbi:hypothetical protein AK812_SmicGene19658 [Symbiodinium microadriaticum]|uniref:Uncharacterized protein n=1 Tax=Symbiodinium microadriaticum TaxID=2951 RepID=A0A1Q9DS00_SYMMI|nr:hypothetical protein AK812_SmicGene19658 [Symbiodinium microadriaticum]